MPSHLTRHVFRRLLANEPIVHRGCLRRQPYTTYRRRVALTNSSGIQYGGSHAVRAPCRTFFNLNLFPRKQQDDRQADMDPGLEKMMELAKMQRLKARLPPVEEVAQAVNKFFKAKRSRNQGIEDTQAELVLKSLQYCLSGSDGGQGFRDVLGSERPLLQPMSITLWLSIPNSSVAHCELARFLWVETRAFDLTVIERHRLLEPYVVHLGHTGQAQVARDAILQYESEAGPDLGVGGHEGGRQREGSARETSKTQEQTDSTAADPNNTKAVGRSEGIARARIWNQVLRAFAREDDEGKLLSTLELIRKRRCSRRDNLTAMIDFYIRQNRGAEVKKWVGQLWNPRIPQVQLLPTLRSVLQWSLENNELQFGHEVARQVMTQNPSKLVWDVIFVWAAGSGKGADEINRMIGVMEASNRDLPDKGQWRVPDITTINDLVEFAISKNDPYLAERFIAIGKERGLEPDSRTYVLQMDYRLNVKDVDGALIAYKSLQAMDLSTNEDVPTVNRLIVALSQSKRHDADTIMNVAADLSDRQARFEPETVSRLSVFHLDRDEVHDVIDLLNTHAFHYSSHDRKTIRDDIVDYCVHPSTPIPRAWDAYTILRGIFDEMDRGARTRIMLSFFHRGRPDMAVHVFNGMRAHTQPGIIPTIDTYVAAFLACAKLRDLDVLEVIHNQLKLDYNIDVNTYLNNALLIGYTACGKPRRALDFWDDIAASREGPMYNSIHIALRACEKALFGDMKAQEIWQKLRRMKIDLDQSLWASYAAALAGNGDTELAIAEVETAVEKGECVVDSLLVASLFDGCHGQGRQKEAEEWCRERWPKVWEELGRTGGVVEDEAGMRRFAGIDRSVTP